MTRICPAKVKADRKASELPSSRVRSRLSRKLSAQPAKTASVSSVSPRLDFLFLKMTAYRKTSTGAVYCRTIAVPAVVSFIATT